MNKPKVLFFDIETAPLKAYVWGLGDQAVRHGQLASGHTQWGIICIGYAWNDGKPAKCIDWGFNEQDTKRVVQEFDEIAKEADIIIGKNSKKFDVKMINAARMLNGLPGLPTWAMSHEDIEQQMRKYFRLPSQSLDYISKELGFGGKNVMVMQDWIDIVEKTDESKLTKMVKYCKKDVEDTRHLWKTLSQHFDSVFNYNTYLGKDNKLGVCKHADCGSANIRKNGTRLSGGSTYQCYLCLDCGRYAGKASISKGTGKEGTIK